MDQRSDTDRPVKGFLGLPTEIRLEIYGHLLVARKWQHSYKQLQGIEIKTERQPEYPQNFLHMSEIVGRHTTYCPKCPYWCGDLPIRLSPAVLRTCKKIHDEAVPILYGKNAFYFSLPDPCTRVHLKTTEPAEDLRLRSQCLWLFGYREDTWHTLFFEMQASLFARFLHKIGKENSACLTTLRFLIKKPDAIEYDLSPMIGQAMKVVMHLLHLHVSGLCDLGIVLMVDDSVPYSSLYGTSEGFESDEEPWWPEIDEKPENDKEPIGPYRHWWTPFPPVELVLYDILKEAVPKLSGLKYLEFKGFGRDPYVKRALKKLEVGMIREISDEDVENSKWN